MSSHVDNTESQCTEEQLCEFDKRQSDNTDTRRRHLRRHTFVDDKLARPVQVFERNDCAILWQCCPPAKTVAKFTRCRAGTVAMGLPSGACHYHRCLLPCPVFVLQCWYHSAAKKRQWCAQNSFLRRPLQPTDRVLLTYPSTCLHTAPN